MISASEMACRIEHTLLAPEATPEHVDRLCEEALRCGFAGVCINPVYVRRVAARLSSCLCGTPDSSFPVIVCPVGFPLGATTTATKVDEARRALEDGAAHIDMVAHLGALAAGDRSAARKDIEAVARVVHDVLPGGTLKVILETAALTEERIVLGCRVCVESGADFVKTSTGFHPAGGATVQHVRLLRLHAAPLRVKASGGIRTLAAAEAMLEAGADRLGTSSGVAIIDELNRAIP